MGKIVATRGLSGEKSGQSLSIAQSKFTITAAADVMLKVQFMAASQGPLLAHSGLQAKRKSATSPGVKAM